MAVEFGLPPGHTVPYGALLKWVKGKLGISDPELAKTVTFKIRNKILKKGIKPKRFMKKAILRLGANNKLVASRASYTPPRVAPPPKAKLYRQLKRRLSRSKKP